MNPEAIPHREDWQDHYPTETAYGHTYPTPEEWVFGDFEQGGMVLSWKRYEGIGHDHTDDHSVVEARDFATDAGTPDEKAMLAPGVDYEYHETEHGMERQPVAAPYDRELTIGGETVLELYEPYDESKLLAAVAAILTRHSAGEDYSEIVREMEIQRDPGENQTLDEWESA